MRDGRRFRGFSRRLLRGRPPEDAAARTAHEAALAKLAADLLETQQRAQVLEDRAAGHDRRLDDQRDEKSLTDEIAATTAWVEGVAQGLTTPISVIVPTRNREALLRRAIDSVRGQRHKNWQLVVVDDGSTDGTSDLLASLDDPRIVTVRIDAGNASVARNRGLQEVRGDLVTYLDDDNVMAPLWLSALAWAFDRWPDFDVAYGARIVESAGASGRPYLHLERFDRRAFEHHNLIDQNVLAHRAGLPEAAFDEGLWAGSDWDIAWRLTQQRDPLMVPVVASFYSTSNADRLAAAATYDEEALTTMRARIAARRPVRVLACRAAAPLLSETRVTDELDALRAEGLEVALAAGEGEIEQSVRAFDPDVLLFDSHEFAGEQQARVERLRRPFALRLREPAATPAPGLLQSPLCLGTWTDEALPVSAVVRGAGDRSAPRDTVVAIATATPDRDWDVLLAGLARLPGVRRRLVVAAAPGHEEVLSELARRVGAIPDPPLLQVNLERDAVIELLARAAALVDVPSPRPATQLPRSVLEGLLAQTTVIVPERDDLRALLGRSGRFYADAEDIERHVRATLAGGHDIQLERTANRELALGRFCDAAAAGRFADELRAGVARLRDSAALAGSGSS